MTSASPSRTKRLRAEWLVFAAVTFLVGALLAWTLVRERLSIETQEGDRLDVQTRVVADNLVRQLDGASKALDGVRAQVGFSQLGSAAGDLTRSLKLLTDSIPGVSTMLVLDSEGTIVAATRDDLLGKNFERRDYFSTPKQSGDPAVLFVSPPFKTSVNTYVVVASRILQKKRDGAFAGVVAATLDPDYFDSLMRSVVYAPDMRTSMIHGDGKVFIASHAKSEQLPDIDASNLPMVASFSLKTLANRLVATRRVDQSDLHLNKAMFVTASRDLDALFAPWLTRVYELVATCAILIAGTGTALRMSQRGRLAGADAAIAARKERHLASERVEMALRGADLGLWDLHVPTDTFVVNARQREMLGFGPDDPLPQGPQWRELIHQEDRDAVNAAILPHLRGEVPSYECEHRMRRVDGAWIWVFSRAMIVERDERGRAIRVVGTHLDVSERRATERRLATMTELLRDSEAQIRQIADNLPALVSRFDNRERLRFVNRAYEDWLHVRPNQLLGRSLQELYGEDSYALFKHHIRAALEGQKVVYEREMKTPGGLRHVEVTLVPDVVEDNTVRGAYALIQDITARHHAEKARARSEERLSLALEGSSQALFDWDLIGGWMYHSAHAAAMRGEPAVEAVLSMEQLRLFVHPEDLNDVLGHMRQAVKGKTASYSAEYRLLNASGGWFWVRARGRVVERDASGRALRLAGTYADINDRKIAEGNLRRLAEHDSLTGLPNRALFHDRLEQALVRSARGKSMALLFLDIDHFKRINDSLGHEAGDEVLKVFALRMRRTLRRSDTVARLAGDEFTIILEDLTASEDASQLADGLVQALREPLAIGAEWLRVTVSIGVALYEHGVLCDDATILRRADAALYEAKRQGRNGYFVDETPLTVLPPGYGVAKLLRLVNEDARTPAMAGQNVVTEG